MSLPVTPHAFQVHRMRNAIHSGRIDGVARFESQLMYLEASATELQHLWHERQFVEFTALIQRGEDLVLAPHLDDFSDSQVENDVLSALHTLCHMAPTASLSVPTARWPL